MRAALETLEPSTFLSFNAAELGKPRDLSAIERVVFSADGTQVFGVARSGEGCKLVAWTLDGTRRDVAKWMGRETHVLALAADPDGGSLAAAVLLERAGRRSPFTIEVGQVAVASGTWTVVAETQELVPQVSCVKGSISSIVLLEEKKVRSLEPDVRKGDRPTKASFEIALERARAALHASGALAVLDGRRLALHDPLGRKPDAVVELGDRVSDLAQASVYATVEGAVVYAQDTLIRVGRDDVLGRAQVEHSSQMRAVSPSPSGKYVALVLRSRTDVQLIDLSDGTRRKLPLQARTGFSLGRGDVRVTAPAWSPSGRAFAVPLEAGTLRLFSADAPKPRPTPIQKSAPMTAWVVLKHPNIKWRRRLRVEGKALLDRDGHAKNDFTYRSPSDARRHLEQEVKWALQMGYERLDDEP